MHNKREVLESITKIAKKLGRAPSLKEFNSFSEMSEHYVWQNFRSWNDAVRAARLRPYALNAPANRQALLEDWGRVVRRLRAVPTRHLYAQHGKFSLGTLDKYLGPWSELPETFRNFAKNKPQYARVLVFLPAPLSRSPQSKADDHPPNHNSAQQILLPRAWPARRRDRPICGDRSPLPGFLHEPINEQGVVLLFGMLANDLGFLIESVQTGFPDCEAKRQIAPGHWQRVRIEFEYESKSFLTHGHPADRCDIIVCWRHNWPNHPTHLEILELSSLIKGRKCSAAL